MDSSLRVYGVQGLRIVDASIFPIVPDAHIQASLSSALVPDDIRRALSIW